MMNYVRTGLAVCLGLWLCLGVALAEEGSTHPLTPADTSSPAATLDSFLSNATAAYQLADQIRSSFLASDRSRLNADEIAQGKVIFGYIRRAAQTLDLSDIPTALLRRQGPETVILLKEVLDRIELPPREQWPTLASGLAPDFERWRIPGTEITIQRVTDGPNVGQYLFTPDTVARVEEFYAAVRDLPYRETATAGWYERYIDNPKGLAILSVLPVRWLIAPPDWAKSPLGPPA